MKKRILGGVEVSAIGMGCMGFSHAEGAQTDIDEAAKIVRQAADMGYTFFNTGWNYSEQKAIHCAYSRHEEAGETGGKYGGSRYCIDR